MSESSSAEDTTATSSAEPATAGTVAAAPPVDSESLAAPPGTSPSDSTPDAAGRDTTAPDTPATPDTSATSDTAPPDTTQSDTTESDTSAPDTSPSDLTTLENDGSDRSGAHIPAQGRGAGLKRLEEEGDVAADYLEELLDIADLDGDIDIDIENGRASVSVVADAPTNRSLRKLVGPEGEVLEALQELTRLAVQARTGERSRLMLDIAGHRAARRRELQGVANTAVAECRESGHPVKLRPMSPFERKVVHDAIAAAGLTSESEGEEPSRRVVVLPPSGG